MISAKILTTSAINSIINNSLIKLREVAGVIKEEDEESIRNKFLDLFAEYIDTSFWYFEGQILLVKLIDYIEEKLGISLESAIYDGKAEKWLKHFTQITYQYTENP